MCVDPVVAHRRDVTAVLCSSKSDAVLAPTCPPARAIFLHVRAPAESGRQLLFLHDQLPHDLRHLLRGVHPAIAGAALDPAGVAVLVFVRVHESSQDARGPGCDVGHEGENHCGCCRCVCVRARARTRCWLGWPTRPLVVLLKVMFWRGCTSSFSQSVVFLGCFEPLVAKTTFKQAGRDRLEQPSRQELTEGSGTLHCCVYCRC